MNSKIKFGIILGVILVLVGGGLWAQRWFFGMPQTEEEKEVFVVGLKQDNNQVADKLKNQELIRSKIGFKFAWWLKHRKTEIQPGGYNVSSNMNAWQMADKLSSQPDLKWVVIPEGWRKEQIGELLAKTFGWSDNELNQWNTTYTRMKIDYVEGTYFPDTYLIPVGESGLDIASRMTRRFDEKFGPYLSQFAEQNIVWTTGLKLASIIQREAGSKEDMPLIAGIMWNRLLQGMNLETDATVQYARGKTEAGWWAPITANDIQNIDSPYNTYKNKGLPPYPISNPGIAAIEAVLHPTETECLFYLHDQDRQIHCAKTLQEHQSNIEKYLKN